LWLVTVALTVVLTPAVADEHSDCSMGKNGECPVQMLNCPLVQPPTLFEFDGLLDTEIRVVMREAHPGVPGDLRGGARGFKLPLTPARDPGRAFRTWNRENC